MWWGKGWGEVGSEDGGGGRKSKFPGDSFRKELELRKERIQELAKGSNLLGFGNDAGVKKKGGNLQDVARAQIEKVAGKYWCCFEMVWEVFAIVGVMMLVEVVAV